jgi:type I restriction enzyme S subunit
LATFGTTVSGLEREIQLLREYRTRLVAEVVTGKLDVRPAARHLPAEPVADASASDPQELTEPEPEETE